MELKCTGNCLFRVNDSCGLEEISIEYGICRYRLELEKAQRERVEAFYTKKYNCELEAEQEPQEEAEAPAEAEEETELDATTTADKVKELKAQTDDSLLNNKKFKALVEDMFFNRDMSALEISKYTDINKNTLYGYLKKWGFIDRKKADKG